jgi:branched-chain amino acid transport system permease protein
VSVATFAVRVGRFPSYTVPAVLAIVAVFLPELGLDASSQRQVILIAILTLLVSGLNLSLGYAGELAMGGAAIYAAGAYVSGFLGSRGHTDLLLQIAVSAVVAFALGLVTGLPGLRLGSWSLAMTSFFLVLLVPDVVVLLADQTGGRLGLAGIQPATIFGSTVDARGYYTFAVLVAVVWLVVVRNIVTSTHGIAFRVLRQSPVLAASSGMSVYRTKLTAYAIGSIPAGLAGTLFANLDRYVSTVTFDFTLVVTILAASILGGSASVYGAVVGAAILQIGPNESSDFQKYALVVYGVFLVIGGVVLSNGVSGIARTGWRRVTARIPALSEASLPTTPDVQAGGTSSSEETFPGGRLSVEHISKSFNGVHALRDVSITASAGAVVGLIGPNGSGKTTLLNVICGFYKADSGSASIDGVRLPSRPHLAARNGVARTFQTPILPEDLTVAEAVAAALYAHQYQSFISAILRLPSYRRHRRFQQARVAEILELIGLGAQASIPAASLPLGTRRLVEVARALVVGPRLLLLDEAASGLDEGEIAKLANLVRRIREAGATVILVEHNFQLVLSLCDRISVLSHGEVVAEGPPNEIATNPRVMAEYLGIDPGASEHSAGEARATSRVGVDE